MAGDGFTVVCGSADGRQSVFAAGDGRYGRLSAAAAAAALPPGAGPGRRQALLRRHGLPPRRPRRRPRRGPGRRSRLRCGAAAAAAGRGPVPEPDHDDILTAAAVAAINAAASLPGD